MLQRFDFVKGSVKGELSVSELEISWIEEHFEKEPVGGYSQIVTKIHKFPFIQILSIFNYRQVEINFVNIIFLL